MWATFLKLIIFQAFRELLLMVNLFYCSTLLLSILLNTAFRIEFGLVGNSAELIKNSVIKYVTTVGRLNSCFTLVLNRRRSGVGRWRGQHDIFYRK